VLSKTDGYCAPETLRVKSSEEIFEVLEGTAVDPAIIQEVQSVTVENN
jgi:hypothetical protein